MRNGKDTGIFVYTGGGDISAAPEFSAADGERRDVRPGAADGIASAVVSFGYSHYRRHYPQLPEHIHPGCFEINFCQRGVPIFELDGSLWPVKPGNVFVSKPGEPHHLATNIRGLCLYWLLLRCDGCGRALGLPQAEAEDLRRRMSAISSPVFPVRDDLRRHFQELFAAYDSPVSPLRKVMLKSTVLNIVLSVIRDCTQKPRELFGRRIMATAKQIGAQPEAHYTISSLAERNNLSQSRFASIFKRATGFPPRKMILMKRMDKARRLVLNTDLPITQIAYSVGFSSPRHFADQFRRTHGESARSMRASARKPTH